jgi:hypothetical protein
MLSKITLALAGEEALKNHCAYCHGKFGMVRHRRAFKAFCSQKCVAHHKAWLRAEARKRTGWLETGRGWLGWKDSNSGIRDHSGSPSPSPIFCTSFCAVQDAPGVLPLQQYLRAIDIINKRHSSFGVLWSFIVDSYPGPLSN